jgi:creatinine amidohydrolase
MTERRYERLHVAEIEALAAAAPIAWVPIGTLEHHGPHLPFGVDRFSAHGLLLDAAARAGGVVLPPSYVACGCLDMPFTLTFSASLVEATVRETLRQLARRGFRLVVVLTGHGPLDLVHLIKRVCAEEAAADPGLTAYGLCWLELNAAGLDGPEEAEPRVIDHAALVETSWMLALQPELVARPPRRRSGRLPIPGSTAPIRVSPPTPIGDAARSTLPPPCSPPARARCSAAARWIRCPTCAGSSTPAGRSRWS